MMASGVGWHIIWLKGKRRVIGIFERNGAYPSVLIRSLIIVAVDRKYSGGVLLRGPRYLLVLVNEVGELKEKALVTLIMLCRLVARDFA